MTNTEIDNLLELLDKKDLEYVKNYLTKEKEKNINRLRQRTFEKYMTNEGKNFSFDEGHGTILCVRDTELIFSNGSSLYYVNKNFFNIKSTNILRKRGLYHHRIQMATEEDISKLEYKLSKKGNFSLENSNYYFENPKYIEGISGVVVCGFVDPIKENLNEIKFNEKEYDTANILLDNPNFQIGNLDIPLLKAESDIGKCYILGIKNLK